MLFDNAQGDVRNVSSQCRHCGEALNHAERVPDLSAISGGCSHDLKANTEWREKWYVLPLSWSLL